MGPEGSGEGGQGVPQGATPVLQEYTSVMWVPQRASHLLYLTLSPPISGPSERLDCHEQPPRSDTAVRCTSWTRMSGAGRVRQSLSGGNRQVLPGGME